MFLFSLFVYLCVSLCIICITIMSDKLLTIVDARNITTQRLVIDLLTDTNDKAALLNVYEKNINIKDYINFYKSRSNLDEITEHVEYFFAENCNYWFKRYNRLNNHNFRTLLYIIKLKTGKIIGDITLDVEHSTVSVFIDHSYSRQGYGSEALSAAVDFLNKYSDYTCVSLECNDEKSRRLARKCGFTNVNNGKTNFYIAKPSEPFRSDDCFFIFVFLILTFLVLRYGI